MSWILGFLNRCTFASNRLARIRLIHPRPIYSIERDTFYLAAGGIPETCLCGSFRETFENNFNGWFVVGLGMMKNSENCRFVSAIEWQTILSSSHPELTQIEGYFVAIKWKSNQVQCFTDQLGLRTFFIAEADDGIMFSTRLDWIAKLKNGCKIDFDAFGAHWLTFNQLSYESLIQGVTRLGPGGVAACTSDSVQASHKPYMLDNTRKSHQSVYSTLQSFLSPQKDNDCSVALGLSGGLDSRTILAVLAAKPHQSFTLYVFGHPEHPDVRISKQIGERENFPLVHFNEPLPQAQICLPMLREYAGQTCAIGPASTILQARYYPQLYTQKKVVIDGGFGEIARRQFFNRILKRGQKALQSGNPSLIYPYLQVSRASIFTKEALKMMYKGTEKQIKSTWELMPAIRDIGKENFLDLLAIRTRLPNYYGFEQSRLDGEVMNYMPFAQTSLLQSVFDAPVNIRKNGKLFRQIIRQYYPSLANYPLVKDTTTYPFYFTTVPAWVWTKFKVKLGFKFFDSTVFKFLNTLSELILDMVHSNEVKCYSAYDYQAIVKMVEDFYNGKIELAHEVDWWLSFEMWRRAINANTA